MHSVNNPDLILAGRANGKLRPKRAREVVEMMKREVKESQKTTVMITHDERTLDVCDRIADAKKGWKINIKKRANRTCSWPCSGTMFLNNYNTIIILRITPSNFYCELFTNKTPPNK